MTITNNTDRTGQVTGSGSTGQVVNFNFKIFDSTDVKAYLTASGVVSEISTSDYVVAIDSSGTGGTVTFSGSYTISGSNTVQVVRVVPETQTLDLAASGPFPAESVEDALDRVVALTHQSLNDDGTGLVYDADSKRITGVSSATASTDAVNKSQLDAVDSRVAALENESSGASGPSLPSPSGQANNTGLLITSNAYALKSPTEMATGIGLGASDAVTHGQITTSTSGGGNGNLTVVGDVSLGTANSKTVTVNDDLILGADGKLTSNATNNEIGINVDHDQAFGTLHVRTAASTAGSALSSSNDLVVESDQSSVGMSFLQPDPDGAGADTTARVVFGVDNDTDRSLIAAKHKQQVSSTGDADQMLFRVGGGTFATFDKNGASTQKMQFDSATQIKNLSPGTASTDAVNLSQIEELAGHRVAELTFYGGMSANAFGSVTSTKMSLVGNTGTGGESFELFDPAGNAWANISDAQDRIQLQPGTYQIIVTGGVLRNSGTGNLPFNNSTQGPIICSAAPSSITQSQGVVSACNNIITDKNGRGLVPREGITLNSLGTSLPGTVPSNIFKSPIGGTIPFTMDGQTTIGINSFLEVTGSAQNCFLYMLSGSSGTYNIKAMYHMTVIKLDGNV
jgi:hypothetical protein